jgi:cell division protein ZapA (FtsZ GTPase activity inhibitor)
MADLTIKVNVGNRTYPVTTSASEQETITKAAQLVNDTVQSLKEKYAVKDMQDLLAMAALQLASKHSLEKTDADSRSAHLQEIEQLVDNALNRF